MRDASGFTSIVLKICTSFSKQTYKNTHFRAVTLYYNSMFSVCVCVWTLHYRLVAYSDDVRHRSGSTIFHNDPQVAVFEEAAIVLNYMRTEHMKIELRMKQNCTHFFLFISASLKLLNFRTFTSNLPPCCHWPDVYSYRIKKAVQH